MFIEGLSKCQNQLNSHKCIFQSIIITLCIILNFSNTIFDLFDKSFKIWIMNSPLGFFLIISYVSLHI